MKQREATALRELTDSEKETLLAFFAKGVHILNLSRRDFDVLSASILGFGLCSKYSCSEGLALRKFVNESGHAAETLMLFKALIVCYRERFPKKVNDGSDRAKEFEACVAIVQKAIGTGEAICVRPSSLENVEVAHLKAHLKEALLEIERGKADSAITKAKAAFEGSMRYAISKIASEPKTSDDIPQLFSDFKKLYGLQGPKNVVDNTRKLMQNLTTAVQMIAEIRNEASDSHGRSKADPVLPDCLSRLYVNAAATMCDYVLSIVKEGGGI